MTTALEDLKLLYDRLPLSWREAVQPIIDKLEDEIAALDKQLEEINEPSNTSTNPGPR